LLTFTTKSVYTRITGNPLKETDCMSLEEALKANTEALLAHTAVLQTLAGQTTAVASGSTAPAAEKSTEEAPKRERGKPAPGRAKRTKEEMEEDRLADEADAAAGGGASASKTEGAVTFDTLKGKLAGWLGEYAKPEDKPVEGETEAQKKAREANFHPEVVARKGALKAAMVKLTGDDEAKLGDIKDDADKIARLDNWFEEKALKADKGHGVGRLAADPEPADADEDGGDDELDI